MNTPYTDVSPMTDRERAILRMVWEHEAITPSSLRHLLNLSPQEVAAFTGPLVDAGFIARSRYDKRPVKRRASVYWITTLGVFVAKRPWAPVYLVRRYINQPVVDDDTLVALYEEHGTVEAVVEATGYADVKTVQQRLRRLRATPGTPGRPRKEVSA